MIGDSPDAGWWAPIVYARTRDVDVWWRALPPQMRPGGPEARALDATIAGDGVRAPRFVLARLASGTLLGVACQTHQISHDMGSDGSRPVPCFIGWLSTDHRVAVPQVDAVESNWPSWAAAAYESWMRPVWAESASRVRQPDQTRPLRPPWELTGKAPDVYAGDRSEFEDPPLNGIRVYPAADAARVWRGVDHYGANATVVTGWLSIHTALQRGLTHACVAEFQGAAQIYPLPPARPAGETNAASRAGPSRDDADAGAALAYGPDTQAYGRAPAEPGRRRGAAHGPDAGYGAAAGRRETSGRSGLISGLGNLMSHGKRAVQDAASSVMGDDPAKRQPPAPPTGQLDWTLRLDQRVFTARRDGYVFSYRIGDPTIVCWSEDSNDEPLGWTGAGWAPLTSAQPLRPEPRQPAPRQPEPRQQSPQQPGSGWPSTGAAPPKAAGQPPGSPVFRPRAPEHSAARGAPLDEFEDAPLPVSRPVLPDDEPDDEPGGEQSAAAQDAPVQTPPPEWSSEEE